jgi:hypothetical protein
MPTQANGRVRIGGQILVTVPPCWICGQPIDTWTESYFKHRDGTVSHAQCYGEMQRRRAPILNEPPYK